jgi:hypothetical protein
MKSKKSLQINILHSSFLLVFLTLGALWYFKYYKSTSSQSIITKEQAIKCVEKEARKDYPGKRFKVVLTDGDDDTWFASVVKEDDEKSLMGYYPVDKYTCETHFAKP